MAAAERRWAALAAVPPALLALLVFRFAVDIPFWDQWEFVDQLGRALEHGPRWSDLWAQHNEHRLVVPKLVMIALAAASGWNVRWEIAASIVCAAASFVLLAGLLRRSVAAAADDDVQLPAAATGGLVALVSWLVFSPAQWENWLWGWQLQIFINVLAVVGAVRLLTAERLRASTVAGAIGCGLVAAYSFANGIAIWIVGVAVLALRGERRAPTVTLAVWLVAAVASSAAYLVGYESVPFHPPPGSGLRDPLAFALYPLHYLGGPVGGLHAGARATAGALGVAVLLAGTARLLGDARIPRRMTLALAAPGTYAIGCAMITAIGRAGMGSDQALASKYVTLATLLWVSLAGIAATLVTAHLAAVRRSETPPPEFAAAASGGSGATATRAVDPIVAVAAAILALIVAGSLASGLLGVRSAAARGRLLGPYPGLLERHGELIPAERAVLESIHPTPSLLDGHVEQLRRHRLSVFRDREDPSR